MVIKVTDRFNDVSHNVELCLATGHEWHAPIHNDTCAHLSIVNHITDDWGSSNRYICKQSLTKDCQCCPFGGFLKLPIQITGLMNTMCNTEDRVTSAIHSSDSQIKKCIGTFVVLCLLLFMTTLIWTLTHRVYIFTAYSLPCIEDSDTGKDADGLKVLGISYTRGY